jgi:hypothetical protein
MISKHAHHHHSESSEDESDDEREHEHEHEEEEVGSLLPLPGVINQCWGPMVHHSTPRGVSLPIWLHGWLHGCHQLDVL